MTSEKNSNTTALVAADSPDFLELYERPSPKMVMQKRVQEHLDRLGWSQSQLARKASEVAELSISQSTINRLMDPSHRGGNPTLRTLEAVAWALGVPAWSLLFDRQAQEPPATWRMERFVDAYLSLDKQGRETIEHILELEAQRRTRE